MKIFVNAHTRFLVRALSFSLVVGLMSGFFSSCHYYKLERKLDPEDADFLSEVRYIITSKERKLFLDLPQSERAAFKEEFWRKRDPDPETEENEFKMEYFNRLEAATQLFIGEGRQGWLTDRGRIYVLFGPPLERLRDYQNEQGFCRELWYYGNFPVVFIDRNCSGRYVLVTYNLTSIPSTNMTYMQQLNEAQERARQTIRDRESFFDFDWEVRPSLVAQDRVEGMILVEVPYANIWFKEEEETLKTVLEIQIEWKGPKEVLVWKHKDSFPIELSEEQLRENKGDGHIIEIPFVLAEDVDRVLGKDSKFIILIKNQTGEEKLSKVKSIALNP